MDAMLKLIENDARLTAKQLAAMCECSEEEIKQRVALYEKEGVIVGYKALVDWDKTDREYVSAWIELKVTPQKDLGFDKVAEQIYNFPEVQSVYLMSGGYDLAVQIEGHSLREVAFFVSDKLAPISNIISTATHFVLKKYKDKGVIYQAPAGDDREHCL